MNFESLLCLIAAGGLLVYLTAALLRPERF
ncbi:MAG: K(+)-transporting ATPase subunit F [Blastocatellia bacterium]|nr:K(+)-transporting ATPase subunit F [Blastocatellia bacterium]